MHSFSLTVAPNTRRHTLLSRDQLLYLLRHDMLLGDLRNSRQMSADEFEEWVESRRPDPNRFPKVPSEAGRELMDSGQFGVSAPAPDRGSRKAFARRVLDRELGISNPAESRRNHKLLLQVRADPTPRLSCPSVA